MTDKNENDIAAQQKEEIREFGSVNADRIHCLTVIGQIEGHYLLSSQTKTTKYEHVLPALVAIEETPDIKGLLILLNTVGGDVEAGLAISEMIASMSKPTVSLVLGGGHSIGVPLAVSAKYSFIAPSATMTVHPVRLNGMVVGVPQTFAYFDRIQERIIRFVSENSKISAEEYRKLMTATGGLMTDVGTLLGGREAVHYAKLHPSELTLKSRLTCLENLKKLGYQTGTGIMVGSPFQTDEMIAEEESKC